MSKQYRTCENCGANLDADEKCDCLKGTPFNVNHYGIIVEDYSVIVEGKHIRQKIYKFNENLYIETWYNGIRLLFHELFD